MSLFIGVDGGGTRTRAVVMDVDGKELIRTEGPSSLINPVNLQDTIDVITRVCREAICEVEAMFPVSVLWAGIAGAGNDSLRSMVKDGLQDAGIAKAVHVGTDADAAFHDAFGSGSGILLISGTGSAALGRGVNGSEVNVGGWGALLGDEGSGYAVGMMALRAVVQGEDGRSIKTQLGGPILEKLAVGHIEDLMAWVAIASKSDIAGLAPLVCAQAEAGDEVASTIIENSVDHLIDHVLTVVKRLSPWPDRPMIALTGGLIEGDGLLRQKVLTSMQSLSCQACDLVVDATRGAAHLAIASVESGFNN